MTTGKLDLTVENFNNSFESFFLDDSTREQVIKDWRAFLHSQFTLTNSQLLFLQKLPNKSINIIKIAVNSIAMNGGRIYLDQDTTHGDISVIFDNIKRFKPMPLIKVCEFDGFFRNCKWFPKQQ